MGHVEGACCRDRGKCDCGVRACYLLNSHLLQPQRYLPKRSMTKTMIGRLQNIIKTMIGSRLENMTKTVGSHPQKI